MNTALVDLRALAPHGRPLQLHQAFDTAEHQAALLRQKLGVVTPAISDRTLWTLPFVRVTQLGGLPASGVTVRTTSGYNIAVAADEPRRRRRLTFAHELKHVLDDVDHVRLYPWASQLDFDPRVEQICDRFAAALLMPARALHEDWDGGLRREAALAARYDVSPHVMRARLQTLGLGIPTRSKTTERSIA